MLRSSCCQPSWQTHRNAVCSWKAGHSYWTLQIHTHFEIEKTHTLLNSYINILYITLMMIVKHTHTHKQNDRVHKTHLVSLRSRWAPETNVANFTFGSRCPLASHKPLWPNQALWTQRSWLTLCQ